ncbi:hypothetical protein LIA77_06998 [Sarocladium implicatum]|nr:hypothetical protein LIA77_06998 [Sarocladium implicatum]
MALLNPVNALIVPFLLLTTIPLALFASITTLLAFSVLSLRVTLVYLDLALSLLPRPLLASIFLKRSPPSPSTTSASLPNSRSSSPTLLHKRSRRRSSATSLMSAGSTTSLTDPRGLGLIPSIGASRDYEGIGGWRVGGSAADDEAWTSVVDPRLELPSSTDHHLHYGHHIRGHHHHRSLSGGPITPGDTGYLMMRSSRTRSPEVMSTMRSAVPNSSRARTPPASRSAGLGISGDSYFPATSNALTPKAVKRPLVPVPAAD